MCGIAGIVMRNGSAPDSAVLDRLESALFHRGPDMSGRYIDGGCALLSTRLAIIGIETGRQPLTGPCKTVLVANGEIYNDRELRAEMPEAAFRTGSDCEPPVHLYAKLGLGYAERLRGMYAIAIYDPDRARLVLSRDPFGIKPLYYVETPAYFAFASEIQALLKAGLALPAVSSARRAELMQLKFTTSAETIVPGVQRVLPGETLAIEQGRVIERVHRQRLPDSSPLHIGRRTALEQLESILSDSVSVHLRSEVPYGLFLSGGIDSSALLALMQRLSSQPVQALSIGYADTPDADESHEAERIAKLVGAHFERIEMGADDFWALAPRIAAAIDDPTTDAAVVPTYMLGQAARRAGLKVTLCGEGADELFGGYSRYRRGRAPWRWMQRKARSRGVFDSFEPMRRALGDWRIGLNQAEAHGISRKWSPLQVLQAIDCREWLSNDLLGKLDRSLMAHGVEGRTPFVDPVVAEFAFRLPDRLKIGPRLGKVVLRDWLHRTLPGARAYARKRGFNPPIGGWMAARGQELSALVRVQPGIAEMAPADAVEGVFANPREHAQAAWSLLFYALWHSHHILGLPCDGSIEDVLAAASNYASGPRNRAAAIVM
jgi:asparagine synthase (glutamine-hydrolysing)